MPISATFTTGSFAVVGATSQAAGVVRVSFSADPRQSDPNGANDGLNHVNYSLTGPAAASISSVSIVSGDPQSLDLHLTAPLATGAWVVTVNNVQTPGGLSLTVNTASFNVSDQANVTELTAGAEADNAARIIRKHLSPALAGPNWDALIEALSQGDDINWDNARLAFNQLFVSLASGKYLDILAANNGILRPAYIGMTDELFRQLVIQLTNQKITHEALRQILEIFYGRDATRAWIETEEVSPFALSEGDSLEIVVDETTTVKVAFTATQFSNIAQASATEVAAVITKALWDAGIKDALATATTDATTGDIKVRIYSASRGLKSFMRVTGGLAQSVLKFNTHKNVYGGDVSGSGYSWVLSNPEQDVTRLTLTTVGLPLIDISGIEADDYVVVGPTAFPVPEGTYTVKAVGYSWSGGNFIQTVDLVGDLGFVGSAAIPGNTAYTFFAPTKRSILDGDRTVVLAQVGTNKIHVQIPATTQAVQRTGADAAYLPDVTEWAIKRYVRNSDGTATFEFETPLSSPLTAGSLVSITGVRSVAGRPWISLGVPGSYPAVGTSDASFGTCWSAVQVPADPLNNFVNGIALSNGDFMLIGGERTGAARQSCNRFRLTGTTAVIDGSEAEGATRRTYQWIDTADLATVRVEHATSLLASGRVFATGGNSTSRLSVNTQLASTEIYDPIANTWTAGPSMALADVGGTGERQDHTQHTLSTGKVVVIGGAWNSGTATRRTLSFDSYLSQWELYNPFSRLSVERTNHQSVTLPDGRVFVIGGQTLGKAYLLDSDVLAYWQLNETTGTNLADISGNGYNLTTAGVSSGVKGKVEYARDWSGGGTATAAGAGAVTTALLGEWTAEFWVLTPFGAGGVVVSYGGAAELAADNILLEVGVNNANKPFFRWEHSAGTDVTQTATNALPGSCHVAFRKRLVSGTYTVDLFVNGALVQSWSGLTNASDGGSGSWTVNDSAEGGSKYNGIIDELRISKVARTNFEIQTSYLRSKGWIHADATDPFPGSETLNSTEFYDPATTFCTAGPRMVWNRSHHTATLLPDGRVMVVGGAGYRQDRPLPAYSDTMAEYWPNNTIRDIEVWDPRTMTWSVVGALASAYIEPSVVIIGNKAYVSGQGIAACNYDAQTVDYTANLEILDLTTMKSSVNPIGFGNILGQNSQDRGFAVGSIGLYTGGGHTSPALLIPGVGTSASGFNQQLAVVNSTTAYFTVSTPNDKFYCSNFGDATKRGGLTWLGTSYTGGTFSNTYPITLASRTTNVATVTVPSTAGLAVGDRVFVNFSAAIGMPSGIKTITGLTATTLTYADPGANVGAVAVTGAVNVDLNDSVAVAAVAAPDGFAGPYIYDRGALPLTTITTTLNATLRAGLRYPQLTVTSTTGFVAGGYVILDFGTATTSGPIKIVEIISGTEMLIDYSHVMEADYGVGTTVDYIDSRNPYIPATDDYNFYVTASSAGNVVAQETVRSAAAAGIEIDFDIVYPGDRGLGGESYPTENADKLSDVVDIWGE